MARSFVGGFLGALLALALVGVGMSVRDPKRLDGSLATRR